MDAWMERLYCGMLLCLIYYYIMNIYVMSVCACLLSVRVFSLRVTGRGHDPNIARFCRAQARIITHTILIEL